MNRLVQADMRVFLREQAEVGLQVDSVVTDPPYGLVSVVKRFGKEGSAPALSNGATGVYARASKGFMGQTWDGEGVERDPATWRAVYDVMKPGAYAVIFGGSRTFHRIACAVEDAGFELRDTLMWLYGTGFPKSHNDPAGLSGWGTALKPAFEPIILARKPLIGTVAENVLTHGTGAVNIDGCRVPMSRADADYIAERIGGFNRTRSIGGSTAYYGGEVMDRAEAYDASKGRWPANVLHDGSDDVEAVFAEFGDRASSGKFGPSNNAHGDAAQSYGTIRAQRGERGYEDGGTASRFFYCAKATRAERDGTSHPTVKPQALMRWLARLITPPGGLVLDPFAGSGTTGIAAQAEGFRYLLVERDAKWHEQAAKRLGVSGGLSASLRRFGDAAEKLAEALNG